MVVGDSADIVAMLALLKCIYTGSLELTDADLSNTLQQPGSAAAGVCSGQVLVLRVIQLADQYGVQGVLSVAISKLTRLFSHQLEWSTIEAVLWMPASLSTDPCMAALRQLAVSGVKQRLGVLDDALAQPSGRQMLQCLPADVLAAILSSDTLATTSENTVLAAVDVWLAGPVAQTLDRQPDSPTDSACCNNAALFYSPQRKRAGPCSATITLLPPSSNNSSPCCCLQLRVVDSSRDSTVPMDCSAQSPLAAALQLLISSVRLPLCSGAFLAAAVEHMPWLCRALQDKAGDLQLLQQYYSSDSEGRYQLAMSLIQQTITCPWQPHLRKALPAGFGSNSGSNGGSSNGSSGGGSSSQPGTSTLLSELRALLDTTPAQQHEQEVRLVQALYSLDCRPPGVLLSSCVLGGYLWQVLLVGAPYRHPSQIVTGHPEAVTARAARAAAAAAAAAAVGYDKAQQQQRQQLAVRIICRPVWAVNLDSSNSSSTARTPCAGASALGRYEGLPFCAASDSEESGSLTEAAATAAGEPGSTCGVCKSLCSIAASKAAAAADRHLPFGGALNLCDSRDVIVGVNVTTAPSAALLQALQGQVAAKPPAEAFTTVRLCWSLSTNTAHGLVPVDVFGISAASKNLVTEWACSNRELPEHAAHPLVPAAIHPADQDPVAAGAAAGAAGGGAVPDGSLAVGWQPELWSRLAYTGELHWLCRLRLLSD